LFRRILIYTCSIVTIFGANVLADTAGAPLTEIRHVFIIVLENESFDRTFGPASLAPYLATELASQGALLSHYYGIGHYSLDNYIVMISGQAPNPVTQSDCQRYIDFVTSGITADGQAIGQGCIYPPGIKTIADQLESAGLSWKAYMEDLGNDPQRENATCGRPKLGAQGEDLTQKATPDDQYAARHNPFVYFHSIVDKPVCASAVVNLAMLKDDLRLAATTPNYVFITPNLCHDGHDGGQPGKKCAGDKEPGGLTSAGAFLRQLVPQILAAPAFQADGLLIITFDEAERDDTSACCDEQPGPNIGVGQTVFGVQDQGPGIRGPGGGRIGAVLISRFIKPGTISNEPYNHYSLLKTIETIFGLPYLGYAAQPGLKIFGAEIFK
jgi:phosphatidylinositol-3-phosphatase